MKKYVYLEKEDGLIIAHHMTTTNRQEVKEKTGACIDNIYSLELIEKVKLWLSKYKYNLFCEDGHALFVHEYNKVHYIESFVEFRNIVSEYRERWKHGYKLNST